MIRTASKLVLAPCIVLVMGSLAIAATSASYGFELDVTLSPKAAAKLAAMGEKIDVAVYWSGEPKPAFAKKANNEGEIELGEEVLELPGSAVHAVVTGKKFVASHLSWIKGGSPRVLVNVYTARKKDPNNLLNCDIYDGDFAKLGEKPLSLACKLIYGDD